MARNKDGMHQTALRLPHVLYERLRKIGDKQGGGAGEEIRKRLEASFERDAAEARDPKLWALRELVADLAGQLELETDGPWHSNPFAFQAFRSGVMALLDQMQPEGKPTAPKGDGRLIGGDDPAVLGRTYAVLVRRLRDQSRGGAS